MHPLKILYAEDELFLGKIVKESLESRHFQVIMESDGEKIIALFNETRPDICVRDIMLPNKDGFSIAEDIRKEDKTIPIIFLTAKTLTEDVVRGFTLGANDYIRKPFSMEELIVRIYNLLNNREQTGNIGGQSSKILLGKFEFHFERQTLCIGGNEKTLSFRESELLKMFYLNRHKIINRKDILLLIWGNDSFFNSRNLDVYITRLRQFLKEDPSLKIITIKGIGYRFIIK